MRYLVPALSSLIALGGLSAAEGPFADARGVGMGGAQVAAVNGSRALVYNPAALAMPTTRPSKEPGEDGEPIPEARTAEWGIADVGVGVMLTGDLGNLIDDLADLDYEAISDANDLDSQQVEDIVTLATRLTSVDDDGNAILFDATAGTSVQIGNWAVGARAWARGTALVQDLDLNNLGVDVGSAANLATDVSDAAAGDAAFQGSASNTGNFQALSDSQADSLLDALNNDTEAVQYIDYLLNEAEGDPGVDQAALAEAVDLIVNLADATDGAGGGGDLDQNTTAVLMRGLGVLEIPVGYGYRVTDELLVGITGKLMVGRVYGNAVLVFDDDNSEAFSEFDENYESSTTISFDLGVLYQRDWYRLGLVGRNLTSPEFDGFTLEKDANNNGTIEARESYKIDDIELEPQVTAGVAITPLTWLTLAMDIDLLETETVLSGFDSQLFKLGAEMELLRFLTLRAGVYDNIAESDRDPVITGGIGLDFYFFELDVSGGISTGDEVEYDGDDYPAEARLGVSLTSWF